MCSHYIQHYCSVRMHLRFSGQFKLKLKSYLLSIILTSLNFLRRICIPSMWWNLFCSKRSSDIWRECWNNFTVINSKLVRFIKNGPFPASFSWFLSFQYSWQWVNKCWNFAHDWIRTADLLCPNTPYYQLKRSHCP